jgi:TPR repeat protein
MLNLGIHYEKGNGVDRDYGQALYWYKRVLEHSFGGEETVHGALIAMCRLYKGGLGVEQSDEMARKYYALSRSYPETAAELRLLEQRWETAVKEANEKAKTTHT